MKASGRSRTPSAEAFIALGSNEGDRLLNLGEAKRRLALLGALTSGPLLETEAVLAPGDRTPQARYLNTVVSLRTALDTHALHAALKRIERLMGRRETTRWGPRVIDLDLLVRGDEVIATPALTVPHPRLHERAFVLGPLAALAPELVVPTVGQTVRALARRLG